METNKPSFKARLGRISAAVFDNGDEAPSRVTFTRLYKVGDDWKSCQSFTREDLPLLMKVAGQVHTHLYE